MPNQYAIAYAPTVSVVPANTTQTGSFFIGNMNTRNWDVVVTGTGTNPTEGNTQFFASPETSSGYIVAIPRYGGDTTFSKPAPSFFISSAISDGTFITICDNLLKTYATTGQTVSSGGSAANPVGCNAVSTCQSALTSAGWFQNYGFIVPA